MRLLDTRTIRFVNVIDPSSVTYAILSHTWDRLGEQSLQELVEIQRTHPGDTISSSFALSPKIRDFCAFARNAGYDYCWIDSCCIDKTSSSELTEAVNSMYTWYGVANVCYAYLADVSSSREMWEEEFRASRWHERAWTLQELIAPKKLVFLACDWSALGSKMTLAPLVEDVTGISTAVLMFKQPLSSVSVAYRMSWAASREATREEDRAYSLFGIFDVHLPTIYGEGGEKAFVRLQEEILRRIPDQSIFAWGLCSLPNDAALRILRRSEPVAFEATRQHGLLASSPTDFEGSRNIERIPYARLRATLRLPAVPNPPPSLDCSAYGSLFTREPLPVYPVQPFSDRHGPTHIVILPCKDPARGWVALLLRGQSISSLDPITQLLECRRQSTYSPNDFSLGAAMPFTATHRGDSLQENYIHGIYIISEQITILRADVVVAKLQRKWKSMLLLLVIYFFTAVFATISGALVPSNHAFTKPTLPLLCVAFIADVVGLGSGFYLRYEAFEEHDLATFFDANQNERVIIFLLRQVPLLCLCICATTVTVYQFLIFTMFKDKQEFSFLILTLILLLGGVVIGITIIEWRDTVYPIRLK